MNLNSRITLAITRFFRKYGLIILIVIIIWLALFFLNQYLKQHKQEEKSVSGFEPDTPVMSENGDVPTKYREAVKEIIDDYFTLCTTKRYEEAYNLLTDDCKLYLYNNDINIFKQYASTNFIEGKTYYIQNYSNVNDSYIYDFYIIDDIESTGGTYGFNEYKEKLTIKKEGNGFKLSNQGYIGRQKLDIKADESNLTVKINHKDITYQRESYNITFTNKTDKYILISDGTYTDAVTLNLGDQKRNATNTPNATFVIPPSSQKTYNFVFTKFADDHKTPTEINLNDIAIFDSYNTSLSVEQAQKLYSFNVNLK